MTCLTDSYNSNCRCQGYTEQDPYKYYSVQKKFTCCRSTRTKIVSGDPINALEYLQQSFKNTPCDGFYNYKKIVGSNCLSTVANSNIITVSMDVIDDSGEFGPRQFLSPSDTIEYVRFKGVESFAGIKDIELNSKFKINSIKNNEFTFHTTSSANSTVNGGGGNNVVAVFENSDNNLIRLKAQTILEYTLLSNFSIPEISMPSETEVAISCKKKGFQAHSIYPSGTNYKTIFENITKDSSNRPRVGDIMSGTINGEQLFSPGNKVLSVTSVADDDDLTMYQGICVTSTLGNLKPFNSGQMIYFSNTNTNTNRPYILEFPGYSEDVKLPVCLDHSVWDPKDKSATLPKTYHYPTSSLTYPVSLNLKDITTADCSTSNDVIEFSLYNGGKDEDVITMDSKEFKGEWGNSDPKLGDPVYKSKGDINRKRNRDSHWVVYLILFIIIVVIMGGYYFIEHRKLNVIRTNMNYMKKGSGDKAIKRVMK